MKTTLLIIILSFFLSVNVYGVLRASPAIVKKYFQYDSEKKTVRDYTYNVGKKNTIVFEAMERDNSPDYFITFRINIEEPLYDLIDIRFYNDNYMFVTYNFKPDNEDYIFLHTSNFDYSNPNALNKIIEILKQGNIIMEYTLPDRTYKHKIDDETAKLFAEILLYSSQN
ncbi:hypothetical protein R4L22_10005 [Brachyspira pilosicoli]|uniref:hypothetical protein n=1 Tax=Brachyspira pilosicoli TaxID=52584 RepID=UPI003004DD9B